MERIMNKKRGFLTIELIIALAVMLLILTAIIMVASSNQSILVDSQTNSEALNIAQEMLEKTQIDTRKDFNLVNPYEINRKYSSGEPGNFRYTGKISIEQTDFFTKLVTAEVTWPSFLGIEPKVKLKTLVTNFNNAVGGDTCSSIVLPNNDAWVNPDIETEKLSGLAEVNDKYPITDIDIYKNKLYATIAKTESDNIPTFFVLNVEKNDLSNPNKKPELKKITGGYLDNDINNSTGLNAVTITEDPAIKLQDEKNGTETIYAYTVGGLISSGQLQIIKIVYDKNSDEIKEIEKIKSIKLSNVKGGQGTGNTIFYKDGYIYLGLNATGTDIDGNSNGPEFHIIDVHKISNDLDQVQEIGHWPKIEKGENFLNHAINDIYVKGNYAYLAIAGNSSDDKKMLVLDISNISEPELVGSFNDEGSNGGKSIYFVSDNLFLGKTRYDIELSILDESIPNINITTSTPEKIIGSIDTENKSIDGVIVRGMNPSSKYTMTSSNPLAFILTPEDFRIFDISNLKNTTLLGSKEIKHGGSNYEPTIDCEGNNFFISSNDENDEGYISIITPS